MSFLVPKSRLSTSTTYWRRLAIEYWKRQFASKHQVAAETDHGETKEQRELKQLSEKLNQQLILIGNGIPSTISGEGIGEDQRQQRKMNLPDAESGATMQSKAHHKLVNILDS